MVEQWTHKPLVVGSSPTLATRNQILSSGFLIWLWVSLQKLQGFQHKAPQQVPLSPLFFVNKWYSISASNSGFCELFSNLNE